MTATLKENMQELKIAVSDLNVILDTKYRVGVNAGAGYHVFSQSGGGIILEAKTKDKLLEKIFTKIKNSNPQSVDALIRKLAIINGEESLL